MCLRHSDVASRVGCSLEGRPQTSRSMSPPGCRATCPTTCWVQGGACKAGTAAAPHPTGAHPSASMRGTALTPRQWCVAVCTVLGTKLSRWPGSGCSPRMMKPLEPADEGMRGPGVGVPGHHCAGQHAAGRACKHLQCQSGVQECKGVQDGCGAARRERLAWAVAQRGVVAGVQRAGREGCGGGVAACGGPSQGERGADWQPAGGFCTAA